MKTLMTILAVATVVPGYVGVSHAEVKDVFCGLKKVSEGVYKTTAPEQRVGGKNDRYFLIEEVDMRGMVSERRDNRRTTESADSIRTKSLWERQHEAYERLRARGELLTPPDPKPTKPDK